MRLLTDGWYVVVNGRSIPMSEEWRYVHVRINYNYLWARVYGGRVLYWWVSNATRVDAGDLSPDSGWYGLEYKYGTYSTQLPKYV